MQLQHPFNIHIPSDKVHAHVSRVTGMCHTMAALQRQARVAEHITKLPELQQAPQRQRCGGNSAEGSSRRRPRSGSAAAATPPKRPPAAAASQRKRCGGTPAQKGPREGPSKRQRCGGAPAERGSAAAKLQRRRCGGNSTGGLNAPASQRERCSGNSAEEAPRGGGLATEATRRQLRPRGVSRRRLAAATTRQDPR